MGRWRGGCQRVAGKKEGREKGVVRVVPEYRRARQRVAAFSPVRAYVRVWYAPVHALCSGKACRWRWRLRVAACAVVLVAEARAAQWKSLLFVLRLPARPRISVQRGRREEASKMSP